MSMRQPALQNDAGIELVVTRTPTEVTIYEVGPRDGLQNEAAVLTAAQKGSLIDGLVEAGVRHIEATSFVHPASVPQLADADEVMARAVARYGGAGIELGLFRYFGVFAEMTYGYSPAMPSDRNLEEFAINFGLTWRTSYL